MQPGMFLWHCNMPVQQVIFKNLGLQDYTIVWEKMKKFTSNRNANTKDEIWFVEHPAVYTLGLNGKKTHIHNATHIPVINIDRGGQITFHGPGQLVAYCLVDLNKLNCGIREFVKRLQKSIQMLLNEYNIENHLIDKAPGVYTNTKKIAALGLRVKRNCTYHGLSINVDMDLSPFKNINPCGYPDLEVSQLSDYDVTDKMESIIKKYKPILKKSIYLS